MTKYSVRVASTLMALLFAIPTVALAAFDLTADLPSGQPVGTRVLWSVTGSGVGITDQRLTVRRISAGEPGRIIYDYSQRTSFEWAPLHEGNYLITASIRDSGDQSTTNVSKTFRIRTVPGSAQSPVVSATQHPLVALYSAPECTAGLFMKVTFQGAGPGSRTFSTDARPCVTGETMNIYIGGMREDATYFMRHQIQTDQGVTVQLGPFRQFTTGLIDRAVPAPNVVLPAGPDTSMEDAISLSGPTSGQGFGPVAANLEGEIIWYYRTDEVGDFQLTRWNNGGTYMMIGPSDPADRFTLREADMAGNTVRETTSRRIAEMLKAQGLQIISVLHHEIRRLPNGHIMLLGSNERLLEDVQGEGIVDVVGDVVLILNENLQLVWSVNFFNILDVTRQATGGETCTSGGPGCPILFLAEIANDWTHSNAIAYSPADGNLIISMRHQDWVIKIDYRDGAGSGALLWALGKGGDFTPLNVPPGVDPWFSHQHDSNYIGNNRLIVYDNGNMNDACLANPDDCVSRGQLWTLDEVNMTATLDTNAELENYSFAVGGASPLHNGNATFNSGFPAGPAASLSRQDEVRPDGTIVYTIEWAARAYRGYRLRDMYTAPPYDSNSD